MSGDEALLNPSDAGDIGYIGLGEMGGPMARRLAGAGFRVRVYDINPKAMERAVAAGAIAAASPREMADHAKVVFTCLPSLPALRSVALDQNGLCGGSATKVLVDLSTTGAHFARELAAALAPRGIQVISSPVTGNVRSAAEGKLATMSSGPASAYSVAAPIMKYLASVTMLYLGEETGKSQTLKLLNNLLSASGMASAVEAFILGTKGGLDPETMLEIINSGEAISAASRNKFPRCILPRQFDYGARMAITIKDISTTLKEADELDVPLWVAPAIRQLWAYAISQGAYDRDGTSLITYLEPWSGVEVRAGANGKRPPAASTLKAKPVDGTIVAVCEPHMQSALAVRLKSSGWTVHTRFPAAGARKPRAGIVKKPTCILLARPAKGTLEEFISGLRQLRQRQIVPVVLNLCMTSTVEAVTIGKSLSKRGIATLDAPLTGTASQATDGKLTAITSGSRDAFVRTRALLDTVSDKVFYMGTRAGSAQLMHQINGSLFSTLFAVTCEAFTTGAKAGLTPETMTKIMSVETGRNAASAFIMPQEVATRRFRHGKTIGEACRELELLSEEARRLGVTTWVAEKTRLLYELAARLCKPGDDITRLVTIYEKWAGAEVRAAGKR